MSAGRQGQCSSAQYKRSIYDGWGQPFQEHSQRLGHNFFFQVRIHTVTILLLSSTTSSYRLSVTTISLKSNSSFVAYMSLIPDMSHSSSSFQSLFTAAVQDYADQTGTTLDDHPLTKLLERCDSVDSISSILQQHARQFSEFRGDDGKIMKSLKRAVNVLYMLSTSSVLGASIGLVCVT